MLNVTRAVFGHGNKVRTAPLYQWDYGQVIQFEGIEIPSNFEAHFSNTPMTGTAITVIGSDNRADIPDSLLQSGGDIWCWVYLHDEVTDGETEYVAVIPVTARPKRDGTEPTPEEQDAIATAIEALNEATEVLDDAIAHTETYRDQAEAYAIQSESWAIGGTGTRQGEDTDNSKYYRDQAEATAQRVTEAVDYFVDTTVPQAIQSVEDEGNAQIALVDAEGTAQIGAVGDAGDAQIALVGAEGTRQVGIVSGEGATQKGNVAAEGSAQIGLVEAEGTAQIGLVQSEGASQIANVSSAGSTQVGNVNSAGATQVGNVNSAGTTQVGLVQAEGTAQIGAVGNAGTAQIGLVEAKGTEQIGLVEAEGATQIAAIEAKGEEVLSEMIDKAPIITDTASGAIASFPDGSDAPIKQLTVAVNPVQDLHGYDNPWPAGGGKNKVPYPYTSPDGTYAGVAFTTTGEKIVASGTTNNSFIFTLGTATLTAGTYRISVDGTHTGVQFRVRDGSTTIAYLNPADPSNAFVLAEDTTVTFDIIRTTAGISINTHFQCEVGSTATDWQPYSNICPITGWTGAEVWDDPKYGGTIRWNQLAALDISKWTVPTSVVMSVSGNEITVTSNTDTSTLKMCQLPSVASNHVYIILGSLKSDGTTEISAGFWSSSGGTMTDAPIFPWYTSTTYTPFALIGKTNATDNRIGLRVRNTYGVGSYGVYKDVMIIDLTELLGETVADYVYALERATAGTGVAWFKNLFPNDYYAYNTGTDTCVSAVNSDPYRHYQIEFPDESGTVYGGTLTVNQDGSGSVSAKYVSVQFDGTEDWSEGSGNVSLTAAIPGRRGKDTTRDIYGWSNYIPTVSNHLDTAKIRTSSTTGNAIQVRDYQTQFSVANLTEFKAMLSATPLQIVYELAEPLTYTLTAAEITTLLGQNNVWANTGDTSVTYRADTKLYIDKKLAALVAALS